MMYIRFLTEVHRFVIFHTQAVCYISYADFEGFHPALFGDYGGHCSGKAAGKNSVSPYLQGTPHKVYLLSCLWVVSYHHSIFVSAQGYSIHVVRIFRSS